MLVGDAQLCYALLMTQINQDLGKKLKEFRVRKFDKVGLRRIADSLAMDYSYLYKIEEGIYTPSDKTLSKMAEIYNLSPAETLEVFNLAHISPDFKKVIRSVKEDELLHSFAFYRKKKK